MPEENFVALRKEAFLCLLEGFAYSTTMPASALSVLGKFCGMSYSMEPCPHTSCCGGRRRRRAMFGDKRISEAAWAVLTPEEVLLGPECASPVHTEDCRLAPTLGFCILNTGCFRMMHHIFLNLVGLSHKPYFKSYNEVHQYINPN